MYAKAGIPNKFACKDRNPFKKCVSAITGNPKQFLCNNRNPYDIRIQNLDSLYKLCAKTGIPTKFVCNNCNTYKSQKALYVLRPPSTAHHPPPYHLAPANFTELPTTRNSTCSW